MVDNREQGARSDELPPRDAFNWPQEPDWSMRTAYFLSFMLGVITGGVALVFIQAFYG